MNLAFTKMEGAGNDFIVIDNRDGAINDGALLARRLCDRHLGIGADGLLLLESSTRADFRMMYYNADGSYGGMCGNGGRCMALFAANIGIVRTTMRFDALDHVYVAKIEGGGRVSLRMKDPKNLQTDIVLPTKAGALNVSFVDTGAPHVVILMEDVAELGMKSLEDIPVMTLGREIRFHDRFQPSGTNVNFLEIQDDRRCKIRTYERGVEAETLACGTGSIASAIVGARKKNMKLPIQITPASGKELQVNFKLENDGVVTDVELKGPAGVVFMGEIVI